MKKILLLSIVIPFFLTIKAQSTTDLWGVTEKGGESYGVIFKTDPTGENQQIIHAFQAPVGGKYPSYGKLCENATGKLYGVLNGGKNDNGIVIEYTTDSNKLVKKFDFKEAINGSSPIGLVKASNGKLYGVTRDEGSTRQGTIFEYDATSNTLTTKVNFTGTNGASPYGVMLVASNGKLYGTTEIGGVSDFGVLFEYDPITNLYTKKIDFDDTTNGSNPRGELISLTVDKLVGTTYSGGTNAMGTVFEYSISNNTLVKKLDFNGSNGSYPIGGLRLADNSLYGNTLTGGPTDEGVVFKLITTTYAFIKIVDLSGNTTGSYPHGSITRGSNGILYGTTTEGGANAAGALFQIDPITDTFTKLWDFSTSATGRYPFATLMQAKNGKLYGTTTQGGTSDRGTLFEFDITSKILTKLADFKDGIEGEGPLGTLMAASNGKIYGATAYGGANGYGVLFECDPAVSGGTFQKKIDFNGTSNGNRPVHAPVEVNGKLYGTTEMGGTDDKGTLYAYDLISGSITKKIDFNGTDKGTQPTGLIKAPNNKLYGMTMQGGVYTQGVIYEYDPASNTFAKKVDFKAATNGSYPYGNLTLASNGKMYGLTSNNLSHKGVLFEYNYIIDTIIKRVDFDSAGGYMPMGELVEGSNGKLYGLTAQGGTNDLGTIFEYDPATLTYALKFSFDRTNNGALPYGSLALSSNGKLYGMTSEGGTSDLGVLFEYNYDNTVNIKLNFEGEKGQNPYYSTLLAFCNFFTLTPQPNHTVICESRQLALHSGAVGGGYTFQWYKNDVLIPSATATDYIIGNSVLADSGKYYCLVNNGCRKVQSTEDSVTVKPTNSGGCTVNETDGIGDDAKLPNVTIYPNPASDHIYIKLNKSYDYRIKAEIKNLLGQQVLLETATGKNQNIEVNISSLKAGVYLISITGSDNQLLKSDKLVKY